MEFDTYETFVYTMLCLKCKANIQKFCSLCCWRVFLFDQLL